ncbi:hypothetical protein ACYJW8_12305 [Frateuria aurantia]
MAAALHCNVSYDTLRRWEQEGNGPPVDHHRDELGKRHKVYYRYADLVEWMAEGKLSPTERKKKAKHASAEAELKANLQAPKQQIRLERMRQEETRLKRELQRLEQRTAAFAFATFEHLALSQDWILDHTGRLVGSVLTVDEETLGLALAEDRVQDWPLAEALAQPWAVLEDRRRYAKRFKEVCAQAIEDLASGIERQHLQEGIPLTDVERDRGFL